jgi:hypothetical protein
VKVRMIFHQGHGLFEGPGLENSVASDRGFPRSPRASRHRSRLIQRCTEVDNRAAAFLVPGSPGSHTRLHLLGRGACQHLRDRDTAQCGFRAIQNKIFMHVSHRAG